MGVIYPLDFHQRVDRLWTSREKHRRTPALRQSIVAAVAAVSADAECALPRERFRSMARPGCAGDDQLFLPSIVDRTCRLESALKTKKPSGDLRRTAFLFQC